MKAIQLLVFLFGAAYATFECHPGGCWCQDTVDNSSVVLTGDVPFGSAFNPLWGRNQTLLLDIYLPPSKGGVRPAAVLVHGGGFSNASSTEGKRKSAIVQRAFAMARRGFVVISINYRCVRSVGGTDLWVEAVEDARTAVAWLHQHANSYQVDTSRIVAYGTSAGAITVAGMCYFNESHTFPQVSAGISISGCLFNDTTSVPAGRHVWNHLYQGSASSPPFIDFHGTADPIVPYRNASKRPSAEGKRNQSCSAIDTQGFLNHSDAPNYLVPIPGAGHVPTDDLWSPPYNTSFWGFLVSALKPTQDMC